MCKSLYLNVIQSFIWISKKLENGKNVPFSLHWLLTNITGKYKCGIVKRSHINPTRWILSNMCPDCYKISKKLDA